MREAVLLESHFPLGLPKRGKVRDIYDLGDQLLFVATDRISAFDWILPEGIPGKGYVLTQFCKFWFERLLRQGIPNHFITSDVREFPSECQPHRDLLNGRSMLVKKGIPLPVEAIVRGYVAGGGWKEYSETGSVGGERLPVGMCESELLPKPIFTPSTKAPVGKHDVNMAFSHLEAEIGEHLAGEIKKRSCAIYTEAATYALSRGILIADTKFEFGLDHKTGQLILIDELLTPDSSRFWLQSAYQQGKKQSPLDKQYVRDYLLSIKWNGSSPPPHLPDRVIEETRKRYFEAMERLIGAGN